MRLCLKPRGDGRQRLLSFGVATDPSANLNAETDAFGNTRHVLNINREHAALTITASCTIEVEPTETAARDARCRRVDGHSRPSRGLRLLGLHPSQRPDRAFAGLTSFVDRLDIRAGGDPLEGLLRLSDTLHCAFAYSPGSTSVISTIDHILETGQGVCQDYAHVMIAIARCWGNPDPLRLRLPARHRQRRTAGTRDLVPCLG